MASTHTNLFPTLGVGLGLRTPYAAHLAQPLATVDWVEITPENYMGRGGHYARDWQQATAHYPCALHGVSLSLGSVDPLSKAYLADLATFVQAANPAWVSDHLSFSSTYGQYYNDLLPVLRTPATAQYVADRIKAVEDAVQRPMLVEHISYYVENKESSLTECDFVGRVVAAANCGLLLDVNNVVVNCLNHGGDPFAYAAALPLERAVEIHVAGFTRMAEGNVIDTHANAVDDAVWALLDWVLQRCPPGEQIKGILLERDGNYPPFEELEAELRRIRAFWAQYLPKRVDGVPVLVEEASLP